MVRQFKNQESAIIHSTGDSKIDGTIVKVIGIAYDCRPLPGTIYIIKSNEKLNKEYEAITMSDSCLMKVIENGSKVKICKKVDVSTQPRSDDNDDENWVDCMDKTIGMIGTVVDQYVSSTNNTYLEVEFEDGFGSWWYHRDSLEIV